MPRRIGSGCITCRIRRVKCDEGKPHCRRCLSTGRRCDGYAPSSSNASRRELAALVRQGCNESSHHSALLYKPTQSPAALPAGKLVGGQDLARKYHLFDRFRAIATRSTALWMDSHFWTSDVLEQAHHQPAIWQGTLALAALNWAWQERTTYIVEQGHSGTTEQNLASILLEEAGTYYRDAMHLAQDMRDPAQALVLTLMLSAAASMMGFLNESRLHLAAGRRILRELGLRKHMRSATEALVRLDFDAMSVGDLTAPYEPLDLPELRYDTASIDSIMDYEQATDYMHRMLRGCMLLAEMAHGPIQPGKAASLIAHLRRWEKRVTLIEWGKTSNFSTSSHHYSPMLMVRVYHALLLIVMVLAGGGRETRYDRHTSLFLRLVLLVEELTRHSKGTAQSSSMEAGLVTPLFVTGSRCRHRWIRRRAVKLLESLNRQEGLWRSDTVAAVLRKLMDIEEEAASALQSSKPGSEDSKEEGNPVEPDECFYLDKPLCEWLRREIYRPWDYWSKPDVTPSSDKHWEGSVRIPEQCRVKEIQTSISPMKQSLHMLVVMSSESDDGRPLQRHEFEVPF